MKGGDLTEASTDLASISTLMLANAEQTSKKTNTVAAASEEMSSTIAEISSNTERTQDITKIAVTQPANASTNVIVTFLKYIWDCIAPESKIADAVTKNPEETYSREISEINKEN